MRLLKFVDVVRPEPTTPGVLFLWRTLPHGILQCWTSGEVWYYVEVAQELSSLLFLSGGSMGQHAFTTNLYPSLQLTG